MIKEIKQDIKKYKNEDLRFLFLKNKKKAIITTKSKRFLIGLILMKEQ